MNLAYLQEHGIHLPSKGLTPALKKQILNSLAYAVPSENSPRSAFDRKKTKIFYADRYGGFGIGLNWGSGRSASAGAFQLKGIGITPLLAANPGHGHSNGAVSLDEGIREAVWGEVNQELPFGGNRVIAIIDKGTKTTDKYGELQRDVLIVRECAIRPAHFLAAEASEAAADKWPITEKERITYNSYLLVEALPHPVDGAPFESTREAAGLLEYTRRVARQYAAAVALKLFHGATSPSNIEFSGRFVDYGVQTALSGYGHVTVCSVLCALW